MEIFTDGTVQVWAVFNADGCECTDLVGIFEAEETANIAASLIRQNILDYYAHVGLQWRGSIDVVAKVLGQYELPEPVLKA